MNPIIELLTDHTFQIVALSSGILGAISGMIGCFAVLRKQSLIGDGIAHSALPGVALVFIIFSSKNSEFLLVGALFTGLISTFLILGLTKFSRIKFDSALAVILSSFFGLGMVLLTYIQKIPNSNQAGLNSFIFGQASTVLKSDVSLLFVVGIVLLLLILMFWKEFKVFTFDIEFAESIGLSPKRLNPLMSFMVVIAIVVGLRTVGVILMSALIIAPAVAARQWTKRLSQMVILSAVFGAFSGVLGTILSSANEKLPTGPTIVICVSIIVIISILFAPERGVIFKIIQRKNNKRQWIEGKENAYVSSK